MSELKGVKIWVTGHQGMLGSALVRNLRNRGSNLLLASRSELDLRDQRAVNSWVSENKPELVFHAGARVGGIFANARFPAEFFYSNLMIQANVIEAAHQHGVRKLIFVGTNCIYPVNSPQPIKEDSFFQGPLEENIRFYATGKQSGIELCRAYARQYGDNFISVVLPNLYGPGDNYHPEFSHVIAGIVRRTHEAKVNRSDELVVWGDGTPRREILNVEDVAEAMTLLMVSETCHDIYNVGCGHDFRIAELASMVAEAVGFNGRIVYDPSKPNGSPGKLLDSTRITALGWHPRIDERTGLKGAYADFLNRFGQSAAERGAA